MWAPNIEEYKRLLSEFHEVIQSFDTKEARLTAKWLSSVDDLSSREAAQHLFADHLAKVGRTVPALVLLASERSEVEPFPGARGRLETVADALCREAERLHGEIRTARALIEDRGIAVIVGEFLSAVEFGVDQLGLQFCGSTLEAFVYPEVSEPDRTFGVNDVGYRDALCGLIGAVVDSAEAIEGEELRIRFRDGKAIALSLKREDPTGPEVAVFWPITGSVWVW